MKRPTSIWRRLRTLALAAVGWMMLHGAAFAADEVPEEGKGRSAWILAYILVVLGIVLGLLLVLRSAKRRERARPETYDEAKPSEKYAKKKDNK